MGPFKTQLVSARQLCLRILRLVQQFEISNVLLFGSGKSGVNRAACFSPLSGARCSFKCAKVQQIYEVVHLQK